MIEVKAYTFEEFLKFYERLGEAGGFEFSDGIIWDKFAGKPVEESIIDFILSDDFKAEKIPFFQTMPTQKHDDLIANLMILLASTLKEKGFAIYPQKTAIVKNNFENEFREPDLVIVKWKEQKRNKYHQVTNPLMLVEVLSKSTKHIDLGEKLLEYQAIPSLQTYLIVWQDEPKAIVYTRKAEKIWEERIYEGLDETIELTYFTVELPMKQVYENINFENKQ
ncbi:MAG: hypothetical protein OHK0038_01210 [Flammeovirgaceae bacterium]